MTEDESTVRLRSINVSTSIPDDTEAKSGVPKRRTSLISLLASDDGNNGVPVVNDDAWLDDRKSSQSSSGDGDGGAEDDNEGIFVEPVQLPQSTHSLLFTQPVFSIPHTFAIAIVALSYACLILSAKAEGVHNLLQIKFDRNNSDFPINVSGEVRVAQYLSIIIVLLMEEEIPTGIYLLRKIPSASFKEKFPDKKYWKFVMSNVFRIVMGEMFLFNAFYVMARATGVIEIFYDVLALQFIQQLDDIAFSLSKWDVLGKTMLRACTSRYFQTEFQKPKKSRRDKKISWALKLIYLVNLALLLSKMASLSTQQIRGDFHCPSITVNFGNEVWEEAWVNMPSVQYEKWISLYPYFKNESSPDQNMNWTLVFSYFNGVYDRLNETSAGRPVYREMRKYDRSSYDTIVPAEIKYCPEISAWVFTHPHIKKSRKVDESGCNWLLRSEETTEYDLMNVDSKWSIWIGAIGKTELSYSCNECSDNTACNLNGQCVDGKCICDNEYGEQYLGTHCEVKLKDKCQTITDESGNVTYYTVPVNGALYQQYSRPVYYNIIGDDFSKEDYGQLIENKDPSDHAIIYLIYSGNRWFTSLISLRSHNITADQYFSSSFEYHAFWARAYHPVLTHYVSDSTTKATPVGVDWYRIEQQGDEQFGPFGNLVPIQLYNQTGRGYFRCIGPSKFLL